MLFRNRGSVTWLVIGLGNPGQKYRDTRHNIGFHAADEIAGRAGINVERLKFQALTGTGELGGEKVLLMKPQTMMNLSGSAAAQAARFYKIPPEHILVLFDDISLPVGKLRIRPQGSAGGHNGIKDIIAELGSDQFPRIKIGVGQKPGGEYDLVDWVLGRPTAPEWKALNEAISRIPDAAACIIADGVQAAMNRYNG